MQSAEPGFEIVQQGSQHFWYDPTLMSPFSPELFEPGFLRKTGKLNATSTGRNTAFFLAHEGTDLVLRHYYRGGLIGRVNKDKFLRKPVQNSRPMREVSLLAWMHAQGLPVPRPAAARLSPAGLFYRADILTVAIPESETLAAHLLSAPVSENTWRKVGETVAQMHRLGVSHVDLNCRNILIDKQSGIWLIDFDRCRRRGDGNWTSHNLDRLKRSFVKEKTKHPGLNWNEADWAMLMQGYCA